MLAAAAAEQLRLLADMIALNRERCETLRDREVQETALMTLEEEATKAFLMRQEALRSVGCN